LRRCDQWAVRTVKAIDNEECVLQCWWLMGNVIGKGEIEKAKVPDMVESVLSYGERVAFVRLMAESNFELAEAEHVENKWKTMVDVWLKTADKVYG